MLLDVLAGISPICELMDTIRLLLVTSLGRHACRSTGETGPCSKVLARSPFIAPKKYFDLYANTNVSEPTDDYPTKGMPEIAWSDWGELRQYADIAKLDLPKTIANVMPEQVTIDLRRAYYAATSFTSFQIGRVLQAIDNLGLRDNTIVAMVGDHGKHMV